MPESTKTSKELVCDWDVGERHEILAELHRGTLENDDTGIVRNSDFGALRWLVAPSQRARFSLLFTRRKVESDAYWVDLPDWRAGRSGGGQDFDFAWESVADREETVGRAEARYRLGGGQRLDFTYRYREIDRRSFELGYEDPTRETVQHRLRLGWSLRKPGSLQARLVLEQESTGHPFLNPTGINELPAHDGEPLPGNSFFFYFQRERVGEATNQPTMARTAMLTLSYPLSERLRVNIQGRYSSDSNDELNTYEWQRDALTAGVNLNLIAGRETIFFLGYNRLQVMSNAMLSAPVMDG